VAEAVPGIEWIVDAHGCRPAALQSCATLGDVFTRVVEELGLHPLQQPVWHVFPGHGGITGILLLSESHLTCHTFPERGFAAFDLFCCVPRKEWPWGERLAAALGAADVRVRWVSRGEP
jgi:S-adenosylmethionine decarboxylase